MSNSVIVGIQALDRAAARAIWHSAKPSRVIDTSDPQLGRLRPTTSTAAQTPQVGLPAPMSATFALRASRCFTRTGYSALPGEDALMARS